MSSGGPMQNPSPMTYIAAAVITAIAIIAAALIGRSSGVSTGITQAQGTAQIQQATSVAQAAVTQIVITQIVVTQIIATSPPAPSSAPVIVVATPTSPPPTPTPGPESIPINTVLYQADWS